MSNKLQQILLRVLLLLLSIVGGYWYVCEINNNACSCITPATVFPAFEIKEGKRSLFKTGEQIKFKQNQHKAVVTDSINTAIVTLANHLHQHPFKYVTIEASYCTKEKNKTAYENLGLARADNIKQLLLAQGVKAEQIQTQSAIKDINHIVRDYFVNGVSINIQNKSRLTYPMKQAVVTDSTTILFVANTIDFTLSGGNKTYIEALRLYSQESESLQINVTGHSDGNGITETNNTLSQERALVISNFLIQQGINKNNINIQWQGAKVPVASNKTKEGRQLNRRAVISAVEPKNDL